jgi:hypothetical protein
MIKDAKWFKWVMGTVGAVVAGGAIMLGGVMIGYPAISQLVGLAVAQSSTLWNNVIDAAKGDSQVSGILGTSTYLFNGVSFDRVKGTGGSMNVNLSGAITPADAYTNPTTASQVWSLNGLFNGTSWDRVRSATGDTMVSTGMTAVGNMIFNGTNFDRVREATADALVAAGIQSVNIGLFNGGTTFDRWDGISATNNTATTSVGTAYVTPLSTWSVINTTSIAATAATVSKASGGGSVRHVATGITACFQDSAINTVARIVHLRDGATGAGTILRTWFLSAGVAGDADCINVTGLNMTGTAATAMTIEFSAAPAATASETVTLTGYSTP